MYETITINQLTNRAANAHKAGDCGIVDTPDTFFAVLYQLPDGRWWNAFETQDEAQAQEKLAFYKKLSGDKGQHIVVVTPEPVAVEVQEEVAVVEEESSVVESSVEAEVASTDSESETSEIVVEKNFNVVVKGGLKSGTHWFDTMDEAKAFVASQIGKCVQVGIQTREVGGWTSLRSVEGCYWDEYQQYRQDWNAGKFTEAFKRDYDNEVAARSGK